MNTKTTTAKSKTTTKAKTTTTTPDATQAKGKGLQGVAGQWKQAIKNCISAYDKDEKLRAKVQRQYKSCFGDTERDGAIDPIDKLHPPDAVLKQIQAALEDCKKQSAIAEKKYHGDLQSALIPETSLERREARQGVKYENGETLRAGEALLDILIDAGALALSLRAPCFIYADEERQGKDKSRSSEAEKTLLKHSKMFFHFYPPQARRDAHLAQTKEERDKILSDARIAESKAMQKKYEEAEAIRKEQIERKQTSNNVFNIGNIVFDRNKKITYTDKEGKNQVLPITGPAQWKYITKLATGKGGYVKMEKGFLQSFLRGYAKDFIDALVISEAKEKGIKGNGLFRLKI
jgi:hypothetical protein